jgi:hypothetical protein
MRRRFCVSAVLAGVAGSPSLVACVGNVDLGTLPFGDANPGTGPGDDGGSAPPDDATGTTESGTCPDATTTENPACQPVGDAGSGDAAFGGDVGGSKDSGGQSDTGAVDAPVGQYLPLCVPNGSFELDGGFPMFPFDSGFFMFPAPWQKCGNSTVDVNPEPTGPCIMPAASGNTYLGLWLLPSSMNAPSTSVSAPLTAPLMVGGQYAFSISAGIAINDRLRVPANPAAGFGASAVLTIWGSASACAQTERLSVHPINRTTPDTWITIQDILTPTMQNYPYLTIEAAFLNQQSILSSYVIVDDFTSTVPCK